MYLLARLLNIYWALLASHSGTVGLLIELLSKRKFKQLLLVRRLISAKKPPVITQVCRAGKLYWGACSCKRLVCALVQANCTAKVWQHNCANDSSYMKRILFWAGNTYLNVIIKVLPIPSSLSTSILPPRAVTCE
jgi:hypothetical protein